MYSPHQSTYFAHWLSLTENYEKSLTQTIASAKVDLNPHQIQAALFALKSPLSKGVILADEVGLGKTIEASLVLAQKWAEQKRKLLLVVPATLRKQWAQELLEKFELPSLILESKNFNEAHKSGSDNPFDVASWNGAAIIIVSYEFAARKELELGRVVWDLVVFDEAHKLRNIYKNEGAKTAKALESALKNRPKILMTATPLQNSLLELYGLVSVIDPYFFGSRDAFKARYSRQTIDPFELKLLSKRLSSLVNRSLRKQVQETGSFNFTKRYSITEDFTPTIEEQTLYDCVSDYLRNDDLIAIRPEARHLVTLVIRKVLASSSYALQGTLNTMIQRLQDKQTLADGLEQDFEALQDMRDSNDEDFVNPVDLVNPQALQEELETLRSYQTLAKTISINAKADALLRVLNRAFDMTAHLGGQRKAVIFTESIRTQAWLAELLEQQEDYAGKVVLLNGSNNDPASRKTHKDWLAKHQGSIKVSDSKAADMKAALVEKFRDDASIMISTEAGAEGINLQFCSLLINYDLPWNPQRVEQRIGRIHRYGQKHDVVVVNFINKGNRADERVFELLNEKFQLFEGVFGASDEILGSIESGMDIEQRILTIYQQCRTPKEIDAAFDELRKENEQRLERQVRDTSRSVLDYFDTNVVQKLNMRKEKTTQMLGNYQHMMLRLAKAELPNAVFDQGRFTYNGTAYDLNWPAAEANDAQFFRPHEGLGQQLIQQVKARDLQPAVTLELNYDALDTHRSDVRDLIGQHGELQVEKHIIETTKQKLEYLLVTACTHTGHTLTTDTAKRLLLVPGTANQQDQSGIRRLQYTDKLTAALQKQRDQHFAAAEKQNEQYYEEESEKLEHWGEDRRVALDIRIKQLDKEITDARRHARQLPSLKEKMDAKRAIKKLERERDKVMLNYHEEKKKIEQKEDELLDAVAAALEMTTRSEPLFSVRWALRGTA